MTKAPADGAPGHGHWFRLTPAKLIAYSSKVDGLGAFARAGEIDLMKSSVKRVRERIAALAAAGTPAFDAVMSPEVWERFKAEHLAKHSHRESRALTGAEVLGVRVRVMPGTRGCVLRHDRGVEFEPKYLKG